MDTGTDPADHLEPPCGRRGAFELGVVVGVFVAILSDAIGNWLTF